MINSKYDIGQLSDIPATDLNLYEEGSIMERARQVS